MITEKSQIYDWKNLPAYLPSSLEASFAASLSVILCEQEAIMGF